MNWDKRYSSFKLIKADDRDTATFVSDITESGTLKNNMMTNYKHITIFAFLALLGCQNPDGNYTSTEIKEQVSNYQIIEEAPTETLNKAQLLFYALYTDSVYTKKALKEVLLDIYSNGKEKDYFDNFNSPTVIGAYIFTSEDAFKKDKASWIAMLSKGPNDQNPRLSYNSLKIAGLQGLNDNIKSQDEINYESLTQYLEKRDLELCSFRQQLGEMEDDCVRIADKKFPDFGVKHSEYATKLMKERRKALASKHNIADSIFIRVSIFGMTYCK